MPLSSRLALAVHTLGVVADREHQGPVASDVVASSASTNPVVVRRLYSALGKAGLLTVRPGPGGGARLRRSLDEITLLDVYQAVENGEVFTLPASPPDPDCKVGPRVQRSLATVFERVEGALWREMREIRVSEIVAR